jgi:hypothetical protein
LLVVLQDADVIPIGDGGVSATVDPPDRRGALRGSDQPLEHVALGGEGAGDLAGVVALLIGNSMVPMAGLLFALLSSEVSVLVDS